MDDNKTIDFIEFFSGLDKLRIKMSDADALACFKYLNTSEDGEIDYNQFCALVEERRRNLDPFTNAKATSAVKGSVVGGSPTRRSSIDGSLSGFGYTEDPNSVHKLYLMDIKTEDLDKLLKLQEKQKLELRKK